MEISVQPRGFSVTPIDVPQPGGATEAGRRITIVDQTVPAVSIVLTLGAYDEFRDFLADPDAAMARQQARSKLELPGPRLAGGVKQRPKH